MQLLLLVIILVGIIIYRVSYVYLNCDQFSLINPVYKYFQICRSRNKIPHGLLFDLLIMMNVQCILYLTFDLINSLMISLDQLNSKKWNFTWKQINFCIKNFLFDLIYMEFFRHIIYKKIIEIKKIIENLKECRCLYGLKEILNSFKNQSPQINVVRAYPSTMNPQ